MPKSPVSCDIREAELHFSIALRPFFIFLLLVMLCWKPISAQNTNLSNGYFFDGEPYLAVNPVNHQHIVVLWMGYAYGSPLGIKSIVSFNGGETWSSPVFQPHFSSTYTSADPSLVFDNSGNIYACYIDYREMPDSGGIFITRSSDGGLSWTFLSKALDVYSDPGKVAIDRPWLTIHNASNQLFITSKPAPWIGPPNRPYFITSSDLGLNWSDWRYIDTAGFLVGNIIATPMAAPSVAPDGAFHCIYPTWVFSQSLLPGFIHACTYNNGQTFSYHGAYYSNTGNNDTLAKSGGRLICDPSLPGHLVFIFLEAKYGDLDVFLIESFDNGITWSQPVRVNSDPIGNGKMQDLVWSDYNGEGDLVMAWRDRRNSAGTGYAEGSEIWGTLRWKDSMSLSPNFRISDTLAAYNDVLSLNGNDFMSMTVAGDTLLAAWGDVRTGTLSIWFSKIALNGLIPTGIRQLFSEEYPIVSVFPNPGEGAFTFAGDPVFGILAVDVNGKTILKKSSDQPIPDLDLAENSPGTYLLHLTTKKGNRIVKIQIK